MKVGLPEQFEYDTIDDKYLCSLVLPIIEGTGDGSINMIGKSCNLRDIRTTYAKDGIIISAVAPFNDYGGFLDALCGVFDTKFLHRHFSRGPSPQEVIEALEDRPDWYGEIKSIDTQALKAEIKDSIYEKMKAAGLPDSVCLAVSAHANIYLDAHWSVGEGFRGEEFGADDWDVIEPLDWDAELHHGSE